MNTERALRFLDLQAVVNREIEVCGQASVELADQLMELTDQLTDEEIEYVLEFKRESMIKKQNVEVIIQKRLAKLDRGIVATPASMNDLRAFASANNGSMDMLLVHQAMQYGMKIALQNIADDLGIEISK